MSNSYKIKDVEITDGPEVKVTLKCKSSQIEEFECSVCFPYNATSELIEVRLTEIVDDAIEEKVMKKEKEEGIDKELKAKQDKCKLLKAELDKKKE